MLYTRKKDKVNALTSVVGVSFLFLFQYVTINEFGITAVIFSIILAFFISIVLKVIFIKKSIIAEKVIQ